MNVKTTQRGSLLDVPLLSSRSRSTETLPAQLEQMCLICLEAPTRKDADLFWWSLIVQTVPTLISASSDDRSGDQRA
jgi:hypothetical protein